MDGISDSMSDIDIGVIFADKDILLDDALALQDDLQRLFVSIPVDLVFLEKASVMIAFKAISHGELIYTVNDEVRTDFEERVLRDYQDFAPFLNKFYHDVQEAIMGG